MVEAYVSFEIARLLKEKGFIGSGTIGCRNGIYVDDDNYPKGKRIDYDDLDNNELDINEYYRVTQQMAMAWLREEHNIFIEVRVYQYTFEGKYCYEFDIFHCGSRIIIREEVNRKFYSYEQLIEAALKYCLTDLI